MGSGLTVILKSKQAVPVYSIAPQSMTMSWFVFTTTTATTTATTPSIPLSWQQSCNTVAGFLFLLGLLTQEREREKEKEIALPNWGKKTGFLH